MRNAGSLHIWTLWLCCGDGGIGVFLFIFGHDFWSNHGDIERLCFVAVFCEWMIYWLWNDDIYELSAENIVSIRFLNTFGKWICWRVWRGCGCKRFVLSLIHCVQSIYVSNYLALSLFFFLLSCIYWSVLTKEDVVQIYSTNGGQCIIYMLCDIVYGHPPCHLDGCSCFVSSCVLLYNVCDCSCQEHRECVSCALERMFCCFWVHCMSQFVMIL